MDLTGPARAAPSLVVFRAERRESKLSATGGNEPSPTIGTGGPVRCNFVYPCVRPVRPHQLAQPEMSPQRDALAANRRCSIVTAPPVHFGPEIPDNRYCLTDPIHPMPSTTSPSARPAVVPATPWHTLAQQVLAGNEPDRDECLGILSSSDDELLDLLAATYQVRRHFFGQNVQLYHLKNAKSGLCPEDCGYCSQSAISDAPIEKHAWLNEDRLLEGARQAKANRARTYCIVASGRGPSDREVEHVAKVVGRIKQELGLHICVCLGLLQPHQAQRLAEAGVDRVNHNLNTSRRFYDEICTTHTYEDRLETLRVADGAGMELCSGLIVGMGETDGDVVDVVRELRTLRVRSIPVNFLHAIEGTPLEETHTLNPRYCLRVLCLLRMVHPSTEIRIAGGREVNLRSLQPLGLYAANSIFVSDYLTTKGQTPEDDFRMLEDMGFSIVEENHPAESAQADRAISSC